LGIAVSDVLVIRHEEQKNGMDVEFGKKRNIIRRIIYINF